MRKTLFLTEEGFFHLKNPPQNTDFTIEYFLEVI